MPINRSLPFHWEMEFLEVFERENPGSMPSLEIRRSQSRAISGNFSSSYLAFLLLEFSQSGGQTDLVAYFFRKAFSLLRRSGTFGLIGTKTISQGDTRATGLGFNALTVDRSTTQSGD